MSACRHRGRRQRLELGDLVRDYGDQLRASRLLNGDQLAALRAIERCRTPALGGLREKCGDCGHERMVWRSCRNRHCPKCQTLDKERWLEDRLSELLPVDYVHMVFTLPHELNGLARSEPRLVYGLLFHAAAESLMDMARDPRHLGAEPGVIAVLHTWGRDLSFHVHLHCIVTAGGLEPTRQRWIGCRGGYLFPVRALSRVFRGKFLDGLRQARCDLSFDAADVPMHKLASKDWVVYAKKPFAGPRTVLEYLARYTHRVALTNDRLLGLRDDVVTLRVRSHVDEEPGSRRIGATDLLARFVAHVLPRGFCRIRHYGILGNRHKAVKLAACRQYFGTIKPVGDNDSTVDRTRRIMHRMGIEPERCPNCGGRTIRREPVPAIPPAPRARAPTPDPSRRLAS